MVCAGRTVLVFFAALALAACGIAEMDVGVDENIDEFRTLVSEGKYGEIWDQSHPVMQESNSREAFGSFMTSVMNEMGAAGTSKQTGWKKNSGTEGSSVVVQRQTQFANGIGTETFTYVSAEDGEGFELAGYFIDSELLTDLGRRMRDAQSRALEDMARDDDADATAPAE